MADLFRLVLLILLLPIILILIGPLLILAALRGRQPVGPITLETSRYGIIGRSGVFLFGLAIWILVWSGLAWLVLTAFLPPVAIVSVPLSPTPTVTISDDLITPSPPPASLTPTRLPTSIPLMETPPEPPPPTNTTAPTSTPTTAPSPTPSASLTSTATPSPPATATSNVETVITITPTVSPPTLPSPTAVQTEAAASPVPTSTSQGTLSFSQRQAVVEVVEEGNLLLREAMTLANEENLQAMETVWQGLALTVARNFATEIYDKYAKPVQVQFEYLRPPTIDPDSTPDEVIVTSREKWTYGGPTQFDREETFQFIYTLEQEDGQWMITRYTYRNLPVSSATPAP